MAREKVYTQDVDALLANGGTAKDTKLEGKVKATGADVSVNSKEYTVTIPAFVAFCGGSTDEAEKLIAARIVNPMLQANDRRELAILCEGPDKVIGDLIKSFVKTGVADNESDATDMAVALMVKRGKVPEGYEYKG